MTFHNINLIILQYLQFFLSIFLFRLAILIFLQYDNKRLSKWNLAQQNSETSKVISKLRQNKSYFIEFPNKQVKNLSISSSQQFKITRKDICLKQNINIQILLLMRQNLILTLVLLGLVLMTTSYEFSKFRVNNKVQNQQQPYAEVCNITHFEFQSNVSLGKNDELNKTFAKLGQKINALNDVTWKVNNSVTYKIYGANPTFYYRDSKQKAEIVSNDTIVIAGGVAEVSIDFKWQKSGDVTKTGTGSVSGLSEIIEFAKQIVIDGDFFKYQLLDYINITFSTPMKLNRIDPATTTKEQQEDILKLVNNIANVTTLRHELQDDIALYYAFYLKMNLHDESMPIDEHFFYKWSSPISSKGDLIVNFTRRPAFIDIERDGIHYGYEAKIDNWNNSKCTAMPPILPLDPKAYGGSQEFISFGFYQNILRYAIEKGQIDTQLTKDLWESRMFQFTAGDLYEVFPQFASMYLARTDVTGDCKTNASQVKIYKGGENTFNTTIRSSCQLSVNRTKFIGFQVRLELEIEGKPTADYVDFGLKSHTEFVTYYDTFGFKLENNLLADQMVKHSLNRLYQGKFFGSGWPLHPQRDYPHFVTEHDATLVYDSTHVNLSLEQ